MLEEPIKKSCNTQNALALGLLIGLCIGLALFLGLYFGLPPSDGSPCETDKEEVVVYPLYGEYDSAAVAADAGPCSVVGKDFLKQGGSVVDAAIGTMLCVGLLNCHSTGIGGGSFMNIYDAASGDAVFINSREVAPIAAYRDMYSGDPEQSTTGASAVAVPGEIAGYWAAHQRYGKLPWADLFQPTIKLASEGFEINSALAGAIRSKSTLEDVKYNLEPIFVHANGSLKKEGDVTTTPELASTLRRLATEGASTFYNGTLANMILKDLEDAPGVPSLITADDLRNYKVEIKPLINITMGDLTVLSPGSPSGGPVLCYILNILKGYKFGPNDIRNTDAKILTYHRILEAFKFAYAKRTELGDENFDPNVTEIIKEMVDEDFAESTRLQINDSSTQPLEFYGADFLPGPDDAGTAHLSIVGEDGSAISITSTINGHFGSSVRGLRTGIIFNNEMDDFSSPNITNIFGVPPSPTNFIEPGKRPQSSMSPTIVINANQKVSEAVKVLSGASGGTKITTGTAWTIMNMLWFEERVDDAVSMKRLHHQLVPEVAQFEIGFEEAVMSGLEKKNHVRYMYNPPGSVVQAIQRSPDNKLRAACDERKSGYPDGY